MVGQGRAYQRRHTFTRQTPYLRATLNLGSPARVHFVEVLSGPSLDGAGGRFDGTDLLKSCGARMVAFTRTDISGG